jgi:hypothetical protein
VAFAGFPPDPIKVFLQNDSPLINPEAPMYNGTIEAGVVELYYMDGGNSILWRRVYYPAVPPGQRSSPEASTCEDSDVPPPEDGATFSSKNLVSHSGFATHAINPMNPVYQSLHLPAEASWWAL